MEVVDYRSFFNFNDNAINNQIDKICNDRHIIQNGTARFNENLFNIQELIVQNGIKFVTKTMLNKYKTNNNSINTNEPLHNRYVIAIKDRDSYYYYIIIRHRYSFEVYDIVNKKIIAYKNYKTNKEYRDWSENIENICISEYNIVRNIEELNSKNTHIAKDNKNTAISRQDILINTANTFYKSCKYFRDKNKVIVKLFL